MGFRVGETLDTDRAGTLGIIVGWGTGSSRSPSMLPDCIPSQREVAAREWPQGSASNSSELLRGRQLVFWRAADLLEAWSHEVK